VPVQGSGFTFAAGNARKLLAIPLYVLGAIASLVTPRRADLWVFGSGSGIGEGALALHEYARGRGHELVWLAGTASELARARELGIRAEPKMSRRGFMLTLRAGLLAITHGFGDVNRFATRGAFVVQLWHGIPLKHIQLDSAVTFSGRYPRLLRWAYRRSAANIDLVPAASELSAARLRTAFGLPADKLVVTGDPRDDVLFSTTKDAARARLGLGGRQILLYAPTWRDGGADPSVPSDAEWRAIDDWLAERDAILVVRPHPHGVGNYAAGLALSPRVRMLEARTEPDITPLLPAFDILVTDYSSIAFDFALTDGVVAFLAPDVDAYAGSRGLYEPYSLFSGATEASTWAELLSVLENPEQLRPHTAHLADTHHTFRDGRNTARVYDEIITRMHGPAKGTRMTPSLTGGSVVPVDSVPVDITVESVEITAAGIILSAPLAGSHPASVTLVGPRVSLAAKLDVSGDSWSATVPLLASRWGGELLPAPSGVYRLVITAVDGTQLKAFVSSAAVLLPGIARVEVEGDLVTISAPLSDSERGATNQARLETEYRSRDVSPASAVFFESFYGQNASCNPRALDEAIARSHPGTTRYWSVVDASVSVPAGAIAVIEGSEQWWRARGEARLIVVNDWLRKRWLKRPHQTVLQTWHGTMLKKIAINRPRHGLRATIATVLESRRWDVLLSQNPHSSRIFRSAYRYRGPIWEEGYPRDDALASGDGAQIRERLGVPAGRRVLLYAPTWRDNRVEHIDHLDVAAFTSTLGDDYVTLIRGHSRTLRPGRDVQASNVIDVTGYPDVTDLFLAADALITDYSSVMFDFSVTGKPIYFFTPDLDHYREQLRGFYFDLIEVAPGPVVRTAAELAELVQSSDSVTAQYADRYAAWQSRFNPRDDGHAADRVVRRLEELGAL
jgi:CDP-glycerol glycerophosphotransferase (TagB/SpsB family)